MVRSDNLTGLSNRRGIYEQINQGIKQSKKSRNDKILLLIDLDNFKTVNDCYGHELGEELLRQMSMRIKSCMLDNKIPARLGADVFFVLLDALARDLESSVKMAQDKVKSIRFKIRTKEVQ